MLASFQERAPRFFGLPNPHIKTYSKYHPKIHSRETSVNLSEKAYHGFVMLSACTRPLREPHQCLVFFLAMCLCLELWRPPVSATLWEAHPSMQSRRQLVILTIHGTFRAGDVCLWCVWRQQQCSLSSFLFPYGRFLVPVQAWWELEVAASQSTRLRIRYMLMSCFYPEWMFPGLTQLQMSRAARSWLARLALRPPPAWLCSAPDKIHLPLVLAIGATRRCALTGERVWGLSTRQDQRVRSLFHMWSRTQWMQDRPVISQVENTPWNF